MPLATNGAGHVGAVPVVVVGLRRDPCRGEVVEGGDAVLEISDGSIPESTTATPMSSPVQLELRPKVARMISGCTYDGATGL